MAVLIAVEMNGMVALLYPYKNVLDEVSRGSGAPACDCRRDRL